MTDTILNCLSIDITSYQISEQFSAALKYLRLLVSKDDVTLRTTHPSWDLTFKYEEDRKVTSHHYDKGVIVCADDGDMLMMMLVIMT